MKPHPFLFLLASTVLAIIPVVADASVPASTPVVAGAYNSCAITGSGALYCWGDNSNGQLTNGTFTSSNSPVLVSGFTSGVTYVAIALEGYTICAIKSGALYCWGDNQYGQIGDGSTTDRYTPTAVTGLSSSVTQVATSSTHTCAVKAGVGYCWGDNSHGQLGNNKTSTPIVPTANTPYGFGSVVTSYSIGHLFTCSLMQDTSVHTYNDVYCWGENGLGQLGVGTYMNISNYWYPGAPMIGPTGNNSFMGTASQHVMSVSAGYDFGCGVVNNVISCWGNDQYGSLGDGTYATRNTTKPINKPSGSRNPITAVNGSISSGGGQVCSYATTIGVPGSTMYCWGLGSSGQQSVGGDATTCSLGINPCGSSTPRNVNTALTSYAPSAGGLHSCWVESDSTNYPACTGLNTSGQVGASSSAPNFYTVTPVTPPPGGWGW